MSRIGLIATLFAFFGCLSGCSSATGPETKPQSESRILVSTADNNPDASIVPIEEQAVSEKYRILSLDVTARGSAVTFSDMHVGINASIATRRIIHDAELVIGESRSKFPLESGLSDHENALLCFDMSAKGEKSIAAGETKTFRLYVRFRPGLDGAEIKAAFDAAAFHKTDVVVKATGRKLTDQKKHGSVTGAKHTLRQSGPIILGAETSVITSEQSATFKATLEVAAFDQNVYVRNAINRWEETASNQAHGGFAYFIRDGSNDVVIGGQQTGELSSSALLWSGSGAEAYFIPEGETREVTLSVTYTLADSFTVRYYQLQPDAFQYAESERDAEMDRWQSAAVADTIATDLVQLP